MVHLAHILTVQRATAEGIKLINESAPTDPVIKIKALEAFTAARLQGVPARLVEFEDEAHQVFKPQNSMVWNREFFGWLDKYLKN